MSPQTLTSQWKNLLAIEDRKAPDLFEPQDRIENTPYADQIRKVFNELSITAIFCVQGVPTIAIINLDEYDITQVIKVHAALWNQSLVSMLVVITDDTVRVFSLSKTPGIGDNSQFEDRCLIQALDAGTAAVLLPNYVSGAESGRLWQEKQEYFNPKERIDYVLLNNLTTAHDLLIKHHLTPSEAQAILIQTMFIAYLEDREIAGADYFESASHGQSISLTELLASGNVENLETLFNQLQRDFSGDLFVAPCSFDTDHRPHCLNENCMNVLLRFKNGREEMSSTDSQMRFWGYDFKYIPVELISAVYDRFLGEDIGARKDAGAYYTPIFLVDTVVTSVWENLPTKIRANGTVLDPACGSGIFLVRCFQRMCEHWRAQSKQQTIRWDSLLRMLNRVHGRDLNGGAVRVAVFSLYIALLEEVKPPDIRKLKKKGRLLPTLWNKTLIQRDFFEEDTNTLKVDVIIGNPPWVSRKNNDQSTAIKWSATHGFPTPSRQEAWAFTWKAQQHLRPSGIVSFLLPAMGFLHNHSTASLNARKRLFTETTALRVINFADLSKQLFEGAANPTTMIMFTDQERTVSDYKFEYWTPKADLNLSIKRFISLSTADKMSLKMSEVITNSLIFKQRLWMRGPEEKLFFYLAHFPRLNAFISEFGNLQKSRKDTSVGWVMGQGFKPFHGGEAGSSSAQYYKSEFVGTLKHLPIKAYTPIAINTENLESWSSSTVHRRGFERGFSGPRILIPQGIQLAKMRLRAAYTEAPFTFQHSIQAIVAPPNERLRLKLVSAILNSRLALWFSFHGTASFGVERPKVHQEDLLTIPCPQPDDLANPKQARAAASKIVKIIDAHMETSTALLQPANLNDKNLLEIDQLVYMYFGLSKDEIILIEDGIKHLIPASQPNAKTIPSLWKTTTPHERKAYASILGDSLNDWFADELSVSIKLTARNYDFAILQLLLSKKNQTTKYTERNDDVFAASLKHLENKINHTVTCNFQTIPDMRIFAGNSLYLIKPLQLRFWLKSSALADADSIASDLQTLVQTNFKQDLAS